MHDNRIADRMLGRHRQRNTQASTASLRFWGRSIGERNPRFVDPAALTATGAPGLVAHPCWLYSVHDTVLPFGHPDRHPLIGGTEWTFHRHVRVDDKVTFEARLVDERRTSGRHAGDTVIQRVEIQYVTPVGEPLATAVSTLLLIVPSAARDSDKYASWKRYRYKPEELAEIEAGYDAEKIRGPGPLYLEEVTVGDTVPGIVRGPLTSEEMILFVGGTRPVASLAAFAEARMADATAGFFHPVTSAHESFAAGLVDDFSARQLGFPAAHDYGIDRISQLASMLTNWIGDAGSLRTLDVRLHEPHCFGDTAWFSGNVTAVTADHVFFELWVRNQWGQLSASGTASAALPSRKIDGRLQ